MHYLTLLSSREHRLGGRPLEMLFVPLEVLPRELVHRTEQDYQAGDGRQREELRLAEEAHRMEEARQEEARHTEEVRHMEAVRQVEEVHQVE